MLFRFSLYGFLKNQRYFEPFLVLFLMQEGFSFFLIGLLVATREATVNLLEIPSGAIADASGRRAAMVFSFLAYIASFVIFAIASTAWLFFAAMILFGLGDSFRTGTHKSMIFEWLRLEGRTDERSRIYGFTRSWSKIGSAVSGLVAAGVVVVSGSYRLVFWMAVVPYVLNIVNLLSYPRELDGAHEKTSSPWRMGRQLINTLGTAFDQRDLRRLIFESMGWDGVFHAAKDYLQPMLMAVAVTGLATLVADSSLDEQQRTAVLVGIVYTILYLLSAAASRNAHHVVALAGSETGAARLLWQINIVLFAALLIAGLDNWTVVLVCLMVLLHVTQNIWRPILISRFDAHSEASKGATILSIESQSQRLATLVFAPVLGYLIDWAVVGSPGEFWPIGALGGGVAVIVFASFYRARPVTSSAL